MPAKHVHVEPQYESKENSPRVHIEDAGERQGHASCKWNGQEYSDGSTVCSSHRLYECWNGKWAEIDQC